MSENRRLQGDFFWLTRYLSFYCMSCLLFCLIFVKTLDYLLPFILLLFQKLLWRSLIEQHSVKVLSVNISAKLSCRHSRKFI